MNTTIIPLRKNIIFKFIEDTTSTRFINSTASGLIVSSQDGQQTNLPRWAEVHAVGPDVTEIKQGDFALIEAGMWTTGFYVDGKRFWKTDEDKVLGVSNSPSTTY